MKTTCCLPYRVSLAVLILALNPSGPMAQFQWLDTFEDGTFRDDDPPCDEAPCWHEQCNSYGSFEVRCGDLHMGDFACTGCGVNTLLNHHFTGDVSARTQVTFIGGYFTSEVSILLHMKPECDGLYGVRLFRSGQIQVGRWDGGPVWNPIVLAEGYVPDFDPEAEYLLQLDRVGDLLEARCWKPMEGFPVEPLLPPASDVSRSSGYAGIGYTSNYLSPFVHGVFRFFQVQDSRIGPEGYSEREPRCELAAFVRDDPNADGTTNMSDAVFILDALFLGTEAVTCRKSADMNDDGIVNISDAIYLLGFLFLGGKAPSEPLESCGTDPTPDGLTCDSYAGC